MLIYHPVFDLYNGIFRLLLILEHLPSEPHPLERVQLLDFYLLFPGLLSEMRFDRSLSGYKKMLAGKRNAYNEISDPLKIFTRLSKYQHVALQTLASYGLIDSEKLKSNIVLKTNKPLPSKLSGQVREAYHKDQVIIDFLCEHFNKIALQGKNGLKSKTGLFEYRYDPN